MIKPFFLLLVIYIGIANEIKSQDNNSLQKDSAILLFSKSFTKDIEGKIIPEFGATGLNGKLYSNQILKGKLTFISLWFTNCHPCIEEIPQLNRLYKIYKDSSRFQFFAITFDNKETTENTIKKYGIEYPVLMTTKNQSQIINFQKGYPLNMILDGEGRILALLFGPIPANNKIVDEYLRKAILKGLDSL